MLLLSLAALAVADCEQPREDWEVWPSNDAVGTDTTFTVTGPPNGAPSVVVVDEQGETVAIQPTALRTCNLKECSQQYAFADTHTHRPGETYTVTAGDPQTDDFVPRHFTVADQPYWSTGPYAPMLTEGSLTDGRADTSYYPYIASWPIFAVSEGHWIESETRDVDGTPLLAGARFNVEFILIEWGYCGMSGSPLNMETSEARARLVNPAGFAGTWSEWVALTTVRVEEPLDTGGTVESEPDTSSCSTVPGWNGSWMLFPALMLLRRRI